MRSSQTEITGLVIIVTIVGILGGILALGDSYWGARLDRDFFALEGKLIKVEDLGLSDYQYGLHGYFPPKSNVYRIRIEKTRKIREFRNGEIVVDKEVIFFQYYIASTENLELLLGKNIILKFGIIDNPFDLRGPPDGGRPIHGTIKLSII